MENSSSSPSENPFGPDESYKPGTLRFVRYNYRSRHALEQDENMKKNEQSKPLIFGGTAQNIRGAR